MRIAQGSEADETRDARHTLELWTGCCNTKPEHQHSFHFIVEGLERI